MVDIAMQTDEKVMRGDKILVTVESIIADIMVVSFVNGIKTFQGALLNVNKRTLPCGINSPESIMDRSEDKLATLSTRFTYFHEKNSNSLSSSPSSLSALSPPLNFDSGKATDTALKMRKVSRPTVRLRPRQVLCNKCQSICNEQNENIGVGRKRKKCGDVSVKPENIKSKPAGSMNSRSERTSNIQQQSEKNAIDKSMDNVTMPSISETSKLHSSEHHDGSQINQLERNIRLCLLNSNLAHESLQSQNSNECPRTISNKISITSPISNNQNSSNTAPNSESMKDVTASKEKTFAAADSTIKNTSKAFETQRTSRKKRSVGSMEDLWDGNVFEDIVKPTSTTQVTPVIKILFGTHGEGTVLKIPSKTKKTPEDINENHDQSIDYDQKSEERLVTDESLSTDIPNSNSAKSPIQGQKFPGKDVACAKAARRALKKAKKEARRKVISLTDEVPPTNESPGYDDTCDPLLYQRRKHKVKHKKKHKDQYRPHEIQQTAENLDDENVTKCEPITNIQQEIYNGGSDITPSDESYTAIKEQCLKQKLSISLKRLNTNAYTRCDYPVSNASSGCKSPDISSEELSELEQEKSVENNGETGDDVSHFSTSHPFAIRFATTSVAHCFTATGRRMNVGDVVWGKIHGFPWWPGKVLSISVAAKGDGTSDGAQAHVAWYGSSTCSLMSCDRLSPFLETFKTRYNKKKRGPYKEAIRQAQSEAQTQMPKESAHENVASVCESSREVNIKS